MKIGIDCRLWNESGIGRYIRNLVEQLQSIDKKNEYVLFAGSGVKEEILKLVQNDNFRIVKADIRWHSIKEQIKFPLILNRENLDLIHFPYFSVPIFYNRPFVVTIHDLIINHFPTGQATSLPFPLYRLKLLGYKFIILQAAKKAKKIITVSNATKQEITDHLKVDLDKVVVTYEGASKITNNKLQIINKSQIQNSKIQNKNYFLYVGNAYPHKNLDRLLQAFNILISSPRGTPRVDAGEAGQYPNISLIFVGKEDYFYKKLKQSVKVMGLDEEVIFYDEANDEELTNLYQCAQALVIPSLMEGFGLPGLEAMSQGCLVLASDIPALHEVCGKAAIYFDPYDSKEIAVKMKQVVNHYNDSYHYSDLVEKGLKRAEMFSWEKMAKETLKIYNSLHK